MKELLKRAPSSIHNLKEKFFFVSYPILELGLPPWGILRESVRRAPRLDRQDLDSSNKLKDYKIPLLSELLSKQLLFNFGISLLNPIEMDAKAIELLSKRLQTHKRRVKAPSKGLKRARIEISSSTAPANATTTLEVADAVKVASITEVNATIEA
ncbi:hypothetical protein COCNU_scaffold006836G000020 [Cocos nucifera]|nr:hypothetical protein [Cocos nucifera]